MYSLLLGAYFAGLKVETLQYGLIDWRVFDQASETSARMRDSVSNVKNLRLDLVISSWWTPSCSYLEGRVRDFITAAPKLEHLQLSFRRDQAEWNTNNASLEHILGDYHWPSLKSINLKTIGTTEDELVSFCYRHTSTLKSVRLMNISLSKGDWLDALKRMRKILALDVFEVGGILKSPAQNLNCHIPDEGIEHRGKCVVAKCSLRPCPDTEEELSNFVQSLTPKFDTHDHNWRDN